MKPIDIAKELGESRQNLNHILRKAENKFRKNFGREEAREWLNLLEEMRNKSYGNTAEKAKIQNEALEAEQRSEVSDEWEI